MVLRVTRAWGLRRYAAGAFFPDRSRATDDTDHNSVSLRLTTQLNQRNKLMIYMVRMPRRSLYHRFVSPVVTPAAASRHTTPIVYSAQAKWTSTVSNRLLLEAGYSSTYARPKIWPQPEAAADINAVRKQDFALGTVDESFGFKLDLYQGKWNYVGSASYVTGSHAFKAGTQFSIARSRSTNDVNQSLGQNYLAGVPSSVFVRAMPADRMAHVRDLGIYAQDSWTMDRLTVNYGVRLEHLNGSLDPRDVPAGRFVPARSFGAINDIPNWTTWAPRLGVVYDLFGDAKTALKASVSKYMMGESVSFTEQFSPINTFATDLRTWDDLNGDDVAQDNEIGPSNVQGFGTRRTETPDPDVKRPYHMEYNVTLQHEVMPRVSVTAAWFNRDYVSLFASDNVLVSQSDYTPVEVTNPNDGTPLTIFNLDPAKRGQVDTLVRTSDIDDRRYNGFDLSFDARVAQGSNVFGGITVGKVWETNCDVDDPNELRFCDQRSSFRTRPSSSSRATTSCRTGYW